MLNKQQQQFLRDALKVSINTHKEYLNKLGSFSYFKKNEYKSLIKRFESLLIRLDDTENVLKIFSMGDIVTLRNISLDIMDEIKKIPNAQEDEKLVLKATLTEECITALSKKLF